MSKYRLPSETKKRMEQEFRQYWWNIKKLERLKIDVIEESSSGDTQGKSYKISDPTAKKAMEILSTRSITYISDRVLYVTKVIMRLNDFEKELFYHIFKEGCNFLYCQTHYNVDKSTYYNIKNKCIYMLAQEWGII